MPKPGGWELGTQYKVRNYSIEWIPETTNSQSRFESEISVAQESPDVQSGVVTGVIFLKKIQNEDT